MRDDSCNRMRQQLSALRAWPVWELPRWLVAFIAGVIAVYALAVGLAVPGLIHVTRPTSFSWGPCWRVPRPPWSSRSGPGRTPG